MVTGIISPDLVETLLQRISIFYQIYDEVELGTRVFTRSKNEREQNQRYYDEVDRFFALKVLFKLED
ncbi:MAG: hypothetical protein ACFFFG_07730 [Candidatus Thorarchaeota archaeon]